MRKIVTIEQKEEIILENILWKGDTMQDEGRNFLGRKNGSFSEESSLKDRLQKFVLCVEDQAILQKIVQKGESSKVSWTSTDSCRWHFFLKCIITFLTWWWLLSSSSSSHGLFHIRRSVAFFKVNDDKSAISRNFCRVLFCETSREVSIIYHTNNIKYKTNL